MLPNFIRGLYWAEVRRNRRDKALQEDAELKAAWDELGKVLYVCFHDGYGDLTKPTWEQEYPPVQDVWRRITLPKNLEALERMLGKHVAPGRDLQEVYRKALENSKPFCT